jgi:hypothetical protein
MKRNSFKVDRHFYSSIFFFLVSISTIGQITEQKIKDVSDSVSSFLNKKVIEFNALAAETDKKLISNSSFSKYFDKYFTYLSFDKEGIPQGNSASLKTSSNDTKLNLNLSYKRNGLIFSSGADLNLSNNIANIISGKDVVGNSTIYFNFSALNPYKRKIKFWTDTAKYLSKKRKILYEEFNEQNEVYFLKYKALLERLKVINDAIASEKSSVSINNKKVNELFDEKEKIEKILEKSNLSAEVNDAAKVITDSFSIRQYELETKGPIWNALSIGWFSGGLSYTKEQLVTYDGALFYNNRISDFLFDKWAINLSYNYVHEYGPSFKKFKTLKSLYLNFNYKSAKDNNYSSVDEKAYSVTRLYVSNDSLFEIKEEKKVRNITGLKLKSNWSHTFGTQMTFIFSKSNFWGINVAGSTTISSFDNPLFNSKLGVLFRFIDVADEKSKVNFELFLQLNDLADSKDSGKAAWDRKTIGISATVPFNKIFFK